MSVDVITQHVQTGERTMQVTFSLDLSKSQVPARKFYSDAIQVARDEHGFHLCFGQRKLFTEKPELRALLDIVMGERAVSQFLKTLESHEMEKRVKLGKLSSFESEPAQTVPLAANFVATSAGDEEATLDFYAGSQFEFTAIANGQRTMHLDPVVRITLPVSLFRALIEDLRGRKLPNPDVALLENAND